MKKNKWFVFTIIILFLVGGALGIYISTPQLSLEDKSDKIPVQSVARLTGYAQDLAIRPHFIGVVLPPEPVKIILEPNRKIEQILVTEGIYLTEGKCVAKYSTEELEIEKEELQLEVRQSEIAIENSQIFIRQLKEEKKYSDSRRKNECDLRISEEEIKIKHEEYNQVINQKK